VKSNLTRSSGRILGTSGDVYSDYNAHEPTISVSSRDGTYCGFTRAVALNRTLLLLLPNSLYTLRRCLITFDNLPQSVPEILPFMATIRGHEPLAPWFVETVEMLCEHCDSPSFDIIKIRAYQAMLSLKPHSDHNQPNNRTLKRRNIKCAASSAIFAIT
jgi:hypothetical protein